MDEISIDQLAETWIQGWEACADEKEPRSKDLEIIDSIDTVSDFHLDGDHETLWKFVLAAYTKKMSPRVFGILAAGPLEDLLACFGEHYIDRIESLARRDPKFNDLLGGVWKNAMSDEVWERVTQARNKVW